MFSIYLTPLTSFSAPSIAPCKNAGTASLIKEGNTGVLFINGESVLNSVDTIMCPEEVGLKIAPPNPSLKLSCTKTPEVLSLIVKDKIFS